MANRETSRYIDEKAGDWVARLDRSQLSAEESNELEAWLSGDPRRRGAMVRANAMAMLSESAQALGPRFEPQQFVATKEQASSAISRRKLLAWAGLGGATAASLVAFGVVAPAFGAITTGKGEVRLVPLDDGSSVMLNTETSLKVRFSDRERRIQLYYGEAYFTIVHDPRRAFVVDVADAHLRAAPGAFRVRDLSGKPLDVLVNQGSLTLHSASEPAAILMRPNTRLILSAGVAESVGPIPQTITPDLVSRELAWRDGKIAFEGERLDQAAAEFGRYSRVRIEISDPALAGEPVSGLFAAGDPVGFSRAIGNIFDTNIVLHDNIVTINRRDKQD